MAETFLKIGLTEMQVREKLLAPLFQVLITKEGFINLKNRLRGNLGMIKKSTRVESLLLSDSCSTATARFRMAKMIVSRSVRVATKTTLFYYTTLQIKKY